MTIHAGASLPGPFFVAFPIIPWIGGALGLILIPAYLMFYLFVGGLWLVGLLLYAIVWLAAQALGRGFDFAITQRDTPPALTDDERDFLRSLGIDR